MKGSHRVILPQHQQPITIRLARAVDVQGAKQIADGCKQELGFVNIAVLREAQSRGWLLVAVAWDDDIQAENIVGFANFRLRKDRNATLYDLAVQNQYRKNGVGTRLLSELIRRVHVAGGTHVRLKCPEELPANTFYQRSRFQHVETVAGKKRRLNVWYYHIPQTHQPLHISDLLPNETIIREQSQNGRESFDPVPKFCVESSRHPQGPEHPTHFFASLTVTPSEMRKLHSLWHENAHDFDWKTGKPNPFQRVLISPVVAHKHTFDFVRELKRTGETEEVMFDSGGYFVQKGDITYYDLHRKLYECYQQEDWADIYVLPDNPPLSKDSPAEAEAKIKQTVEGSLRLYEDLPHSARQKAMPVVHATQSEHLDYCLRHYTKASYGFQRIGFGSFPTSGTSNSINRLNVNALLLLRQLNATLARDGIELHTFGICTPPAIYLLSLVGVHSFDSNGWMRSGGYGLIFLPFMRGYLVTFNSRRHGSLNEVEFKGWKEIVGHNCPFCDSFERLSENRWDRIMHNLTVMAELETHQRTPQEDMFQTLSETYYRMLQNLNG